ncbi:hypothetical protein H490_0100195 [Leucobacter sp. UCD-THU]|uniref:hypothetical protein n=1 Tax=unclassified Leucobacter TaxID=2621730 RepID=UPI0003675AF3|nr:MULTISPECIES: hypothetical protein [unclassified Leucobacter]EYT56740.1 hypothetical protein H490_0100195 [Leucobacter sp. UCD-THU]RGE16844.1 hypothetical protein D1J51_16350 [Leucobacter sp. wl10]
MSKRARSKTDPTAVVMVRIVVAEDGTLSVTVDGAPYLPPEFSPPWRRSAYPHIVDAISQHTGQTLRVDVIEIDGRVITDYRTPPKPRPVIPEPAAAPVAAAPQPAAPAAAPVEAVPQFAQLAGTGFVPGEDVAVAVIISHTETAPDGIARALIDSRYLAACQTGEAILVGRISGTLVLGRPE